VELLLEIEAEVNKDKLVAVQVKVELLVLEDHLEEELVKDKAIQAVEAQAVEEAVVAAEAVEAEGVEADVEADVDAS